jgi:gluconate 2-dehydrogenase gamma chain
MSKTPEKPHGLSRRKWLKDAGLAGAAAVAPVTALAQGPPTAPWGDPLETLTLVEAEILEAITARLIPTDDRGPGAREARAARYIDRALGGALAASLGAYREGLAAIDRHARTARGPRLVELAPRDQDAVLTDLEQGKVSGFTPNSTAFFTLVRTHTIQGTFGDPYYGGNANFVGWDLLGYPGLRLAVAESDQRFDPGLPPSHISAYDMGMFTPKPSRAGIWWMRVLHGD